MFISEYSNLILLAIAVLNAFTAYMAYRARTDIAIVEKATNSMKDALVASTRIVAHGEGKAEGIAEGKTEIAVLNEKLSAEKSK